MPLKSLNYSKIISNRYIGAIDSKAHPETSVVIAFYPSIPPWEAFKSMSFNLNGLRVINSEKSIKDLI